MSTAAGAALTLVAGLVLERWRRKWDRQADLDRRGRQAGEQLLEVLDEALLALAPYGRGKWPDDGIDNALALRVERLAIHITAADVREQVRKISTVLRGFSSLSSQYGHSGREIGWCLRASGMNAVGALVGTEALREDEDLNELVSELDEYYSAFDEA